MEEFNVEYDYFWLDEEELTPLTLDNLVEEYTNEQPEEDAAKQIVKLRWSRPESKVLDVIEGVHRLQHTSNLRDYIRHSHIHPGSFVIIPARDYDVIKRSKDGYQTNSTCVVIEPTAQLAEPIKKFFYEIDQVVNQPI